MLDAVSVRPVAEGICLRLAVKIIFRKKKKRIEHIDDFFGCADSTLYNVLARQPPKYLFDVPFFIEAALARKTPSSPFDKRQQLEGHSVSVEVYIVNEGS